MWKKGPPPEDTWYWGALVTAGVPGMFYLAEFRGDHALVRTERGVTKVPFRNVAWYANCLRPPPGEPVAIGGSC